MFTSSARSCARRRSPRLSCARPPRAMAQPSRASRGSRGREPARNGSLGSYQKASHQHERGILTPSAKVFMARGMFLQTHGKKNKGLQVEVLSCIPVYIAFFFSLFSVSSEPCFDYEISAILKVVVSNSGSLEKDGNYSFEPMIS